MDYYNDGYALLTIDQEGQFLVVPEGKKAPEGLDMTLRFCSSHKQYLSGSNLGHGSFPRYRTGLTASSFPEPRKTDGISRKQRTPWNRKIIYAGKYSAPDYELIL